MKYKEAIIKDLDSIVNADLTNTMSAFESLLDNYQLNDTDLKVRNAKFLMSKHYGLSIITSTFDEFVGMDPANRFYKQTITKFRVTSMYDRKVETFSRHRPND